MRGHKTLNWGFLGSFGVKTETFSNHDNLYIKMKLLFPSLKKVVFEDIQVDRLQIGGYLGSFGVKISCSSDYENDNFSRSLDPKSGGI